jgi:hypothetical protein
MAPGEASNPESDQLCYPILGNRSGEPSPAVRDLFHDEGPCAAANSAPLLNQLPVVYLIL